MPRCPSWAHLALPARFLSQAAQYAPSAMHLLVLPVPHGAPMYLVSLVLLVSSTLWAGTLPVPCVRLGRTVRVVLQLVVTAAQGTPVPWDPPMQRRHCVRLGPTVLVALEVAGTAWRDTCALLGRRTRPQYCVPVAGGAAPRRTCAGLVAQGTRVPRGRHHRSRASALLDSTAVPAVPSV